MGYLCQGYSSQRAKTEEEATSQQVESIELAADRLRLGADYPGEEDPDLVDADRSLASEGPAVDLIVYAIVSTEMHGA